MPSTTSSAVLGAVEGFGHDPVLGDNPELETETGEGDGSPSEVAESEETESEESASETEEEVAEEETPTEDEETETEEEPEEGEEEVEETEPAPASRTQQRIQRLTAQAARARKFEPILEILESDPALARDLVARRLGLTPQAPATTAAPAKAPERPPITLKDLQEKPVETLRQIVREELGTRVDPAERVLMTGTVETLVENYKARAAQADPDRWPEYEPIFDALVSQTDAKVLLQSPKQTLRMLKNMAFGEWYEQQTARIAKARKAAPAARPAQRGRKNALTTARAGSSGNARSLARATRALTDEERILADRYGIDLVMPDEGE